MGAAAAVVELAEVGAIAIGAAAVEEDDGAVPVLTVAVAADVGTNAAAELVTALPPTREAGCCASTAAVPPESSIALVPVEALEPVVEAEAGAVPTAGTTETPFAVRAATRASPPAPDAATPLAAAE